MRETLRWGLPTAALACCSVALAVPTLTIDGQKDAAYGTLLESQNSSVIDISGTPVSLEGNVNNSNIGGVGALPGGDFNTPGASVTTGLEICIPLSETDWDGNVANLRMAAFQNGGGSDFLSNQVVGGLDNTNPANLGGPPFNFEDDVANPDVAGDQFVGVGGTVSGATITVDGVLDTVGESWDDSVRVYENTQNPTGFGDNTNPNRNGATGSEINNAYMLLDDNGTPFLLSDDLLYIFIGGNFENNGNKFEIFLDTTTTGSNQNELESPPNPNAAGLSNLQGSFFDAGFAPDYYLRYNVFGTDGSDHALDVTRLGDQGNFTFGPRVSNTPIQVEGILDTAKFIVGDSDNSNVNGVASPGGGGGPDVAFLSDPATVTTGLEFKIDITALGYSDTQGFDDTGAVALAGFLRIGNLISNQVLGGVPNNSNNIGRSDFVDFSTLAGTQQVVVPASGGPVSPLTIDGTLDGGYGTALYVNNGGGTGNSTSLGDTTVNPGANGDPDGSEIDAVYGLINQEGGSYFLYVFVAGNFGNFDRTSIFIDCVNGEGQNVLRGDNPTIDAIGDNSLNALEGLVFEPTFAADFLVQHHLGLDENMESATFGSVIHFMDGAQILTEGADDADGPPIGGRFDGGVKSAINLAGTLNFRIGFGDNDDPTINFADGSEADGLFAYLDSDGEYLCLLVTGNLETNFTKLDIWLDFTTNADLTQNPPIWSGTFETDMAGIVTSVTDTPRTIEDPPGSGTFVPNPAFDGNPEINAGLDALQRMGGPRPIVGSGDPTVLFENGITFDTMFEPDHYININNGAFGSILPGEHEMFGSIARLRGVLSASDEGDSTNWGVTRPSNNGIFEDGDNGPSEEARLFIDNSNIGGVVGGTNPFGDVSDAPNVVTGVEVFIPLSQIRVNNGQPAGGDWDGSAFKVFVVINGEFHSFVSNQTIPPICGFERGEVRNVDFRNDEGDQFLSLTRDNAGNSTFSVANSGSLPMPCDEPMGACCFGTTCVIDQLQFTDCVDMGGTFLGEGTDCSGDPCTPTGACCFGALCQDNQTQAFCEGNGGVYFGDDSLCIDVEPCPSAGGACCFDDALCGGVCQDGLSETDCNNAGGKFAGEGTTCADVPAPCDQFCQGDVLGDGNGDVTLADFTVLANNFGAPSGATRAQGDFQCNGDVTLGDFTILANNFGCVAGNPAVD
jgi:hypothetical protein